MIRFEELQTPARCPACGSEDVAADGSCAECDANACPGCNAPAGELCICEESAEDQRARELAEDLAVETYLERRRGIL